MSLVFQQGSIRMGIISVCVSFWFSVLFVKPAGRLLENKNTNLGRAALHSSILEVWHKPTAWAHSFTQTYADCTHRTCACWLKESNWFRLPGGEEKTQEWDSERITKTFHMKVRSGTQSWIIIQITYYFAGQGLGQQGNIFQMSQTTTDSPSEDGKPHGSLDTRILSWGKARHLDT